MNIAEFQTALANLVKSADELKEPEMKRLLICTFAALLYPRPVQSAIADQYEAVTRVWAKRLRDAFAEQDEREEREWFRDFEWPDSLE